MLKQTIDHDSLKSMEESFGKITFCIKKETKYSKITYVKYKYKISFH